jgi:hypothetical protein
MLLEESGISEEIAAERGYRTARRRSEVPEAFKDYQRRPGLVAPMFSPDGVTRGVQLRPDKPRKNKRGKPLKYETPEDVSPVVDVHPRMLEVARNGTGPLLITEGAKTGDAATSRGIPTVVLAGVWMWCVPKEKPFRLKPCFDYIRLGGRPVLVAFDSDCMTKASVQRSLSELVPALEARGADVKVIYLPDAPDGSKQGIDDYLAAGGTVREMFALARRYEPADVGRIRLSRDERLRAGVDDLVRRWESHDWARMVGTGDAPNWRRGYTARDILKALIDAYARHGKPKAGVHEVQVSTRTLAVDAAKSRPSAGRAIRNLEADGMIEVLEPGAAGEARTYRLLTTRANLSHNGRGAGSEKSRLRTFDPDGKGLRAPSEVPRLRWSSPGRRARRGVDRETRRVRDNPQPAVEGIKRLEPHRGAVVDTLLVADGAATVAEIRDAVLPRSRLRDFKRRNLTLLEEAGIIALDGETVRLAGDWRSRLEDERRRGGEIEREGLERERHRRQREAYRRRRENPPDPHPANVGADGRVEDLRPAEEPVSPPVEAAEARVSPGSLAAAVRDYLDLAPHDACQPAGWIGLTLWALDLFGSKPTPSETAAAIEELGGERYLRDLLERVRGAA